MCQARADLSTSSSTPRTDGPRRHPVPAEKGRGVRRVKARVGTPLSPRCSSSPPSSRRRRNLRLGRRARLPLERRGGQGVGRRRVGRGEDEAQAAGLEAVGGEVGVARRQVGFGHEGHAEPELPAPEGGGGVPAVELDVVEAAMCVG